MLISSDAGVSLVPDDQIEWRQARLGRGDMGSLYRSQHELLPVFKMGAAAHVNNVELGRKGRWRSNVWTYPGASSLGSDSRRGLHDHPTVKPTALLKDAILDLTRRGDIVVDPFLGSGSTVETVLGNLRTVMEKRGHAKALATVLRAVIRELEQGTTESVVTVTVAREADVTALKADIKSALVSLGADGTHATIVDDTIIGGLIATYNHRQIDQSYRSKLVTLYQSITN